MVSLEPLLNLPNDLHRKWKGKVSLRCCFYLLRSAFWCIPGSPRCWRWGRWCGQQQRGVPQVPNGQQEFAAQHVELYMRYLGRDSRAGEVAFDQEKTTNQALQAKLDSINHEHGDAYIEGVQPRFDILKARCFDSSWNWARQDALSLCSCTRAPYDIIFGRLTTVDREITVRCIALLNRADHDMLQFILISAMLPRARLTDWRKSLDRTLIDNTREVIGKPPMYEDGALP